MSTLIYVAVVMLEFQSSSPRKHEALLGRRHRLAQRSALRAANVKAKRAEQSKMSGVVQNVSKPNLSPDRSVQKLETGKKNTLNGNDTGDYFDFFTLALIDLKFPSYTVSSL